MRRAGRAWGNRWVVLYAWRPGGAGSGAERPSGGRRRRDGAPAGPRGAADDGAGGPTRIGFTVGRRLGKAVRRNRVRRLLAEAFRRLAPRVEPGWWLVVVARDAAAELDWDTACRALEDVLRKARLLRPPAPGGLRDAWGDASGSPGACRNGGPAERREEGTGPRRAQASRETGGRRPGAPGTGGRGGGPQPAEGAARGTEAGGMEPC